jgi:hypothetical protein
MCPLLGCSRHLRIILLLTTLSIVRSSTAAPSIAVGKPHPPLVLWTIAGDAAISIDTYRGTKVLVIYFATWSPQSIETLATWTERTRQSIADKKLVLLGVMEEQHADRCRLFAQWKKITDMPLLHDPLNLAAVDHVPMVVGVDEHGFVRLIDPDPERLEDFIHRKFKYDPKQRRPAIENLPDPKYTERMAGEARNAASWREHGDALILGGLPPQIDEAITSYPRAVEFDANDGLAFFRLGVAYRIRYDRPERQPGDFQAAIDAWQQAVRKTPKNAVCRSRLAQYGLRFERPANLYRWIRTARKQIAERGETPVELAPQPTAVELAKPQTAFRAARSGTTDGDAAGGTPTDDQQLIAFEPIVVPSLSAKNKRYAQVLLVFRPSGRGGVQWDNRGDPLRVWLEPADDGVKFSRKFAAFKNPTAAGSSEERTLNFEVMLPRSSKHWPVTIKGHALYRVSGGGDGAASLLRRDFEVKVPHKSGL